MTRLAQRKTHIEFISRPHLTARINADYHFPYKATLSKTGKEYQTKESNPDTDAKQENTDLDTSGTNSVPVANVSPFASLRIRNFRLLLTGTTLSNAGQWIQQVTLSWLVYNLTGSGTMLGNINLVRSVASLGMIPTAGVLIDPLNRL